MTGNALIFIIGRNAINLIADIVQLFWCVIWMVHYWTMCYVKTEYFNLKNKVDIRYNSNLWIIIYRWYEGWNLRYYDNKMQFKKWICYVNLLFQIFHIMIFIIDYKRAIINHAIKIFYKIILLAFFPNVQLEYITVFPIYFFIFRLIF